VAEVTLKHGQSVVLKNLGSNYGCYIYQKPVIHYMLYLLKSRHVYTQDSSSEYTGSYNNYYNYIDSCSVSSSAGFVNAQETLSITKKVVGSDTTRDFVFNVYLLQYLPDTDTYMPVREGTFNLSYTNPTGDEPKTVDIGLRSDISKETTLTEGYHNTSYTVNWSVAQVKVAAGQTVTIEGLPAGIAYFIEEVPVDNYTITGVTSSSGTVNSSYNVYNLLSLSDESFTYTNTYVPPEGNDLSITKTVTGDMGDTNQSFEFSINLKDENGNPLSEEDIQVLLPGASDATIYTTDENGSITLSLKHGDTVTLQNLPPGTEYTITETGADNYTTNFSVSGGTYELSSNNTLSGTMPDSADVSVSVTNNRVLAVPTGIRTEIEPFLLLLSFSLVTILLMVIVAKNKKHIGRHIF
jgi:hypothetical protein